MRVNRIITLIQFCFCFRRLVHYFQINVLAKHTLTHSQYTYLIQKYCWTKSHAIKHNILTILNGLHTETIKRKKNAFKRLLTIV